MNAHQHAVELGAAAIDFPLDAAERLVLAAHLASCLQCRADLEGMAHDARRLAARPGLRMPADRSAVVRASLEGRRRGMSSAMVLVAAALLLLAALAVAAVGAEVQRRLDESRLAVEPVPSVAAPPSAVASPAASLVPPSAWTLTSLGRTPGIPFQAVAVEGSDRGWVAIGSGACVRSGEELFDCAAPVARSVDGRAWTQVGALPYATAYVPVTSGREPGIVDLAAGPDGYVAAGFTRHGGAAPVMGAADGAAWWSGDGLTWERTLLEPGARPATVFRAPDRWLICGVVYRGVDLRADRPIGAIWTSTDGRAWTRIEDEAVFDVGGYVDAMEDPSAGGIRAFAWNGEALVAGGAVYAEGGLSSTAAAWLSADGETWGRVGALPAGQAVEDLAAVGGSFVAAVRHCPATGDCATVVLRSADGRAWDAMPGTLASGARMAVGGETLLLVTGEYRELDVRATADGASWDRLGVVTAPERVNWGAPVLVARPTGRVDLLIRFDPLTEPDTEADAWTALWEIAPAR